MTAEPTVIRLDAGLADTDTARAERDRIRNRARRNEWRTRRRDREEARLLDTVDHRPHPSRLDHTP